MTLTELMESAKSEDERKRVLLAYMKGMNDGMTRAMQMIFENIIDGQEDKNDERVD